MTIEIAIKILNKNQHRGWDSWHVAFEADDYADAVITVDDTDWRYYQLTEFEAIAIAEKYESGK